MRYFGIILLVVFFFSCSEESGKNSDDFSYLPEAVGGYSTVNIIADQPLWDNGLKAQVQPVFERQIEGLLNPETEFDITTVRSKVFNRLFKRQRALLIFVTSKKVSQEGVSVKKNVYADGQIVVQLAAKTSDAAITLFKNKKDEIFQVIDHHRTTMIQKLARKKNNDQLEDRLLNNHGIGMIIPKSYRLGMDSLNFFYAFKQGEMKCEKFNHKNCYYQTGVFSYFFNYTDQGIFTPEKFIALRDSVTKIYIEGKTTRDSVRSYMQVYKDFPVATKNITINGQFAYEVKGWWDMKNGTMGGPFVSVATVDEMRNRVIVTDAFVFGPNFNKRRFIKELEAICLSTKGF
ncbi:MAG: hypothetical protein CMP61_00810 [Flavobacteriales bacterium]|nr:hypothetical protein [Flavobacteriales bacterium]